MAAEDLTKTVFSGLEGILSRKQGLWEADEDFRPEEMFREKDKMMENQKHHVEK